jgi:hypothetical protein
MKNRVDSAALLEEKAFLHRPSCSRPVIYSSSVKSTQIGLNTGYIVEPPSPSFYGSHFFLEYLWFDIEAFSRKLNGKLLTR